MPTFPLLIPPYVLTVILQWLTKRSLTAANATRVFGVQLSPLDFRRKTA